MTTAIIVTLFALLIACICYAVFKQPAEPEKVKCDGCGMECSQYGEANGYRFCEACCIDHNLDIF